MNTRRVKRDQFPTPTTPQATNSAGGSGRGRGVPLGRRTFIDDLVDRTDSSTGARLQETPNRRNPADPGVLASGSTVEKTRAAVSSSAIPGDKDTAVTMGPAGRGPDYHINGRRVTKEEWDQYHQKLLDSGKTKKRMRNKEKMKKRMRNKRRTKKRV